MSIYTIELTGAAILAVTMIAIYRFTEGKKRFLLLCAEGTIVWLIILALAIYLRETRIAIFVAVMLVAYIASLVWVYARIVNKTAHQSPHSDEPQQTVEADQTDKALEDKKCGNEETEQR